MNPLKWGPELKLPKLRKPSLKGSGLKGPGPEKPGLSVPGPLADFYYDLRDRRLLPVLALVLVAIAATPILLGDKREPVSLPPAATAALEAASEPTSKLTVVEAAPGLRDYHKRLDGRSPSDPFVQQYTGPQGGGGESGAGSASGGSGEGGSSSTSFSETSETTTVEVEGGSGGGSSGGGSGGGSSGGGSGGAAPNPQGSGVRLYEFVLDVQISHAEPTPDGSRKMSKPQVRHKVKSLTQLPGKKRPVVTVGGVNLHNGKVFFLVSDEVRSLDGEFTCVTRAPGGLCELLELQPGFPLELVYGPEEVAYRIKVTNVGTAWAGHAGDQKGSTGKGSAGKGAAHGSASVPRSSFGAVCGAGLARGRGVGCAHSFSK
jgi:hypothetical protein